MTSMDDSKTVRVLLTGAGPFHNYTLNPSWMAVRDLHDLTLSPTGKPRIHITCRKIKVAYEAVLHDVPLMHARPPVLSSRNIVDNDREPYELKDSLPVPEEGYDVIIHVGVGLRGGMRIEQVAHKKGYMMPDVDGKFAHILAKNAMRTAVTMRGFANGYESFDDELRTSVDVPELVEKLRSAGVTEVSASSDAGRFLCDFIFYCSLAQAQAAGSQTAVLFVHCPPIDEELSTSYVTNALKEIVINCV